MTWLVIFLIIVFYIIASKIERNEDEIEELRNELEELRGKDNYDPYDDLNSENYD